MVDSPAFRGREELLKSLENPSRLQTARSGLPVKHHGHYITDPTGLHKLSGQLAHHPDDHYSATVAVTITAALWGGYLPKDRRRGNVGFNCQSPVLNVRNL